PSADFCRAVRPPLDGLSRRGDTRQISRGKFSRLPCTIAGSTLRTLDGYGLRGTSSARPMLAPHIRFLSIDSHVCSTLLSDPASRRATPCALLVLRLHQVAQRTYTSKLLNMPGTHRDRGEPRDSAPPTPPGIRVRT